MIRCSLLVSLVAGALLGGCASPGDASGVIEAPLVQVVEVGAVDLDMLLPTDVLWLPTGDILVLDGYKGDILRFGPDATARGVWSDPGNIGRAVRMAPAADGGVWVVVPGSTDAPGVLLRLGEDGAVHDTLGTYAEDGGMLHPVDVVDLGETLLVADRDGGLDWLDSNTGKAIRHVEKDAEQLDIRRVVDLAPAHDGTTFLVDTMRPSVLRMGPDGVPANGFGRYGLSAGRMARPTAVAPLSDGNLLTADAVLGAVQAFEPDGDLIGLLAEDGAFLRFGHPTSVRTNADANPIIAVLEGEPAKLHLVRLVAPLPPAPRPSLIRTTLVEPNASPAGDSGETCLQCHDGLVLDGREVWDPVRNHHPRDMVPTMPLPSFFPLDDKGRVVCTTCHSPHGVVDPAAVTTADSSAPMVRHKSSADPFYRITRESDALCVACHTGEIHANGGSQSVASTAKSHPTGPALIEALKARATTGVGSDDPTTAGCLSCHAMHGAAGEHITRDPGDGTTCLGCHPTKGRTASNHLLGRAPGSDLLEKQRGEHVVLSAEGGIGCLSCHDLGGNIKVSLLRSLRGGEPVCFDCHSKRDEFLQSPHARLTTNGKPTCTACHSLHGGQRAAKFVTLAPVSVGDPVGCLSCHEVGKRGATAGITPGRAGHLVDGRTLEDGNSALTCLSCHDPHSANKPTAGLCQTCHEEQKEAADRGGHGRATCLDCHPAHAAPTRSTIAANPASLRCLACHAPDTNMNKGPKIESWEHPVPIFLPDGSRWVPLEGLTLYADDGKPAAEGVNGDLACLTCHVVHGPEGSGEDNLRRAVAGWREACAACHGDDALVLYRYFHQPDRRADLSGTTP